MDMQSMCINSGIYGVYVNNAVDREDDMVLDVGCGNSCVIDTEGRILIEASSPLETWAHTTIPLSAYRKRHWIPRFPKELYSHAYDNYTPRFPPNSYIEKQPQSIKEMGERYQAIARW
jgi:predicted amidohydrolase